MNYVKTEEIEKSLEKITAVDKRLNILAELVETNLANMRDEYVVMISERDERILVLENELEKLKKENEIKKSRVISVLKSE